MLLREKNLCVLAAAGVLLAFLRAVPRENDAAAAVQTQLAGTLPAIDASRYASLQDAIDAVGEAGGIVQIIQNRLINSSGCIV